jgi:hypothetical protein
MLLPGRIATMAVRSARAATGSDRRGRKAREGLDARRTIDLTDRCRSAGGYVTYQQLMGLANGYADSKVLLVANELGVFTAIGTGGHRVNALAAACETTHEGMRLLLHALAGLGLLRRKADRYWNTPLGLRFLDGHSPQAITNLLWLLNHHWSDWTGMARAIRRGRPGWATVTKTAEFRRRFALAMQERSHVLAPPTIASFRLPRNATRFLDLGGGAGSYSIALARQYPTLQGLVIDQSVAVARRLIRQQGLADRLKVRKEISSRCRWQPGSMSPCCPTCSTILARRKISGCFAGYINRYGRVGKSLSWSTFSTPPESVPPKPPSFRF